MRRALHAVVAAALVSSGTACGLAADSDRTGSGTGDYPLTVQNCSNDVEIPQRPERIVLLTGTDVGFLAELDVLDRVVGKAGAYPPDYYDEKTNAAVEDIPSLSSRLDDKAGLQISDEVILEAEPDLVLDQVRTDRFHRLGASDIPVLNDEAMCPEGVDDPGFDDVYTQLESYGEILDREDAAARGVTKLKDRVAAARAQVPDGEDRSAAVLYPAEGSAPTAYGNRSMAAALVEEAGFTNVYDDLDERRTEVSAEDLVGRDPDIIILLHVDGDPADVEGYLESLPGADQMTAVRNDDVMTMLFSFAEPPTPTAVDGLDMIIDHFGDDA